MTDLLDSQRQSVKIKKMADEPEIVNQNKLETLETIDCLDTKLAPRVVDHKPSPHVRQCRKVNSTSLSKSLFSTQIVMEESEHLSDKQHSDLIN